MLKALTLIFFCFSLDSVFAKEVSLEVFGRPAEVSISMTEDQVLLLNGFRQIITRELEELKLDSRLYWTKLEKKKQSPHEEFLFLKTFFTNELVGRPATQDSKTLTALSGTFSGFIDIEKLKSNYEEVIADLEDTKLKTFYLLANIELDKSMSWEDVGVTKSENFTDVILESWKKMIEKDVKGFERVVLLEKDFINKPAYMNSKSVSLKWKSILKKVSGNNDAQTASYELTAQYILQNTKSGTVISSLDFPEQKRTLDGKNKKVLSSTLASLIYNLLFSQSAKIQGLLEVDAKALEMSEVEIKMASKIGLSEIYQINTLLQEKFKDLKLTSQMKSYSTEGASILVRAEGTVEMILDSLSKEGGKFPLNEQKVLLFNRTDKTFAILPKESNN